MEPRQKFVQQSSQVERRHRRKLRIAMVLAMLLCAITVIVSSPATLFAQSPVATPAPTPPPAQAPAGEPDGVIRGGYAIRSSAEIGYRTNDVTGSGDMYDTLVNLQTGPRLLDQTLSMQSVDHQGLLFDDLYLNSFGWAPASARCGSEAWFSGASIAADRFGRC